MNNVLVLLFPPFFSTEQEHIFEENVSMSIFKLFTIKRKL